jgi:hypothetical protein
MTRTSRRAFLKAIGASVALLPVLECDLARASCLSGPKRALFVTWPNGLYDWPTGSGTNVTLTDTLSPLQPFVSDLNFIRGLKYQNLADTPGSSPYSGHEANASMFTGTRCAQYDNYHVIGGGPSIDQYISATLASQGTFMGQSLLLGLRSQQDGAYYYCWRGARDPVPADNDPWHVFNTVFGSTSSTPSPELARQRATRKSVLDHALADLNRFCARLGRADQIGQHSAEGGSRRLNVMSTRRFRAAIGLGFPARLVVVADQRLLGRGRGERGDHRSPLLPAFLDEYAPVIRRGRRADEPASRACER